MKKQVYTSSFGYITVEVNSNKYNGYTIDQIKAMKFAGWNENDKKLYIENCIEVINIQMSGLNLGMIECIKNINFEIAKMYL